MKAGTRAKTRYLSRGGRRTMIILLTMLEALKDFLPNAGLKPEEKRNIQRGVTMIGNQLIRMGDTFEKRFWRKLLDEGENTGIQIVDMRNEEKAGSDGWKNYREDDIFDLADFALSGCENCKKNFAYCRKYSLLMALQVPPAQEETNGCPYEQEE
ncbi:MAG: DUF5651 domain-containing protein [Hydrogeniiclostridium sp.]